MSSTNSKFSQDVTMDLQNYCISQNHPLPIIKIVDATQTKNGNTYTALCYVGSIHGVCRSDNKENARQLVASQVLQNLIKKDAKTLEKQSAILNYKRNTQANPSNSGTQNNPKGNKFKPKKDFRHVSPSPPGPSTSASYTYTTYHRVPHEQRCGALKVIYDPNYETAEDQAMDMLTALHITPKITMTVTAGCKEAMLYITVDGQFRNTFSGLESKVYKEMIHYFTKALE